MFIQGLSTCELFQCILSFYFISAEAFKAIKVHLMHIPIAGKDGIMTIAATRFVYELFQFIFSFYFIRAEAFKAIKVHVARKHGPMTIVGAIGAATWFILGFSIYKNKYN